MIKLPKKILPIPSDDKNFHEKWYKSNDLLDFPHPFRCCIIGPPNSGKTCLIKNIVLRQEPEFQKVIVIHPDSEYTKEYMDIDAEMIELIPSPKEFEGLNKTLVVLDDIEFSRMSQEMERRLGRLCGYVSTHKNISVIISSQNWTEIPPLVRRCLNIFIVFSQIDMLSISTLARRLGFLTDEFRNLMRLLKNHHDSLWIDKTKNSPAPVRLNGYKIIHKKSRYKI